MSDQPAATPTPVSFSSLTLMTGWSATVMLFDGHPIPVLSMQDGQLGWRHYAWPKDQLAAFRKWLNASETETALAVGVQGKAN